MNIVNSLLQCLNTCLIWSACALHYLSFCEGYQILDDDPTAALFWLISAIYHPFRPSFSISCVCWKSIKGDVVSTLLIWAAKYRTPLHHPYDMRRAAPLCWTRWTGPTSSSDLFWIVTSRAYYGLNDDLTIDSRNIDSYAVWPRGSESPKDSRS